MGRFIIPGLAIIAITTLDAIALCHGINGVMFSTSVIIIAGIGGYKVPEIIKRIKKGG